MAYGKWITIGRYRLGILEVRTMLTALTDVKTFDELVPMYYRMLRDFVELPIFLALLPEKYHESFKVLQELVKNNVRYKYALDKMQNYRSQLLGARLVLIKRLSKVDLSLDHYYNAFYWANEPKEQVVVQEV